MAATLNQQPLPLGWESRVDPRTRRNYYINHKEHITTWDDPRLLTKHAQSQGETIELQGTYAGYYLYGIGQPPGTPKKNYSTKKHNSPITFSSSIKKSTYSTYYGSPRLIHQGFYPHTAFNNSPRPLYKGGVIPFYVSPRTSPKVSPKTIGLASTVDEKLSNKLCMQFPTVDEGYIRKMLKKYKNREQVVVSALMSEGHPRTSTHNTPEMALRSHTKAVPADPKLALKLYSIFPTVEEDWLYNLLSRHNNNEEEVIASLVSAGYPFTQSPFVTDTNSFGQSSPKIKLRYLKGIFPSVDESVLFDVLINCDNQSQDAIARLSSMGYQKKSSPVPKPSSKGAKDAEPAPVQVRPQTFNVAIDKVQVKKKLVEEFSDVSEMIVNMALESAQYNETKARQLLQAMTPIDSQPTIGESEQLKTNQETILSMLKRSHPSSEGSSSSIGSNVEKKSHVDSTKASHSAQTPIKLDGSPKPPPRSKGVADMKRLSYDVNDNREATKAEKTSSNRTKPTGPDSSLRKGPNSSLLSFRSSQNKAEGAKSENKKGANPNMRKGPEKSNFKFGFLKLFKRKTAHAISSKV